MSASEVEPQLFFSRRKREAKRKKSYSDFVMDLLYGGYIRAQRQRRELWERKRMVQGGLFTLFFVRTTAPHDARKSKQHT